MVKINKPEYEFDMEKFNDFCKKYQLEFPQEFVEYLKQYNDAELEPNHLDFGINECGIRYFYGTSEQTYCDLAWNYEIYRGRMPEKCIPIGDEECGNQICMSWKKIHMEKFISGIMKRWTQMMEKNVNLILVICMN